MTDDAILSLETALMYQNAYGFEPVHGNLTHWRGVVKDRSNRAVSLDISLPANYPNVPPEFTLPRGTAHPAANTEGRIYTRSMQRWRANSRVYQVLRDVRQAIASGDFSNATEIHKNVQDDSLVRQISVLKQQRAQKEQELMSIKTMKVSQTRNIDRREIAEESLLNLESEIYGLEDDYDRLEIDEVEFTKKFYSLRKRYYMIEASMN